MDMEEDYLKWEPYILKRVECEDEDLTKLVHSLACKEFALRDRASDGEILDKAAYQYDEIRSMVSEEKPIVEITKALISYAVSLDRIERKLNKLKLARYGKDADKPEKTKESEPKSEEEALEAYFQTPEFRTIYCGWVDKFIKAPPKEKQWRALEIHYFGRKIGAIWPEEVKETLLGILDNVACNRLSGRKTRGDKILAEIKKDKFWSRVYRYVQLRVAHGRMSKRSALTNYYKKYLAQDQRHIEKKKLETFRKNYLKVTKS